MEEKNFGALVFVNEKPCYELAAEKLQFAAVVRGYDLVVAMRAYRNPSMIELLRAIQLYRERDRNDADAWLIKRPKDSGRMEREFFDHHSLGVFFRGQALQDGEVRELDDRFDFKAACVRLAYDVFDDDEQEPEDGAMPFLRGGTETVRQFCKLCDSAGRVHTVNVSHALAAPNAEQYLRWENASRVQTKSRAWSQEWNYEDVERSYDALIRSTDGFLLDGQPCVEANRPDWIGKVPFLFKLQAAKSLFSGVRRKN